MTHELDDLRHQDATEQSAQIRAGNVSATELTSAYLAAIERLDGGLRSYVSVTTDDALTGAQAADEMVRDRDGAGAASPLLGVTVSFKDVVDVAGAATTHSCGLLVDNIAAEDSPIVRDLRSAGLSVLGKTNVPEFCTSMTSSRLNGTCRNPWDTERTPGGSSGGAAAAC